MCVRRCGNPFDKRFPKNKSGMTSQLAFLADRKEISQKAVLGLRPASAKSARAAPGCVTSCAKNKSGMTSQLTFLADRKKISQKSCTALRPASAKPARASPGCVTRYKTRSTASSYPTRRGLFRALGRARAPQAQRKATSTQPRRPAGRPSWHRRPPPPTSQKSLTTPPPPSSRTRPCSIDSPLPSGATSSARSP